MLHPGSMYGWLMPGIHLKENELLVLFCQHLLAYEWVPGTVDRDHNAIMDALRRGDVGQVTQVNKEIYTRVARECVEAFRMMNQEMATVSLGVADP